MILLYEPGIRSESDPETGLFPGGPWLGLGSHAGQNREKTAANASQIRMNLGSLPKQSFLLRKDFFPQNSYSYTRIALLLVYRIDSIDIAIPF